MERVSNVSVRAPADCKTLMFIRGGDRLFSGLNSGEAFSPRTCRSIRILWQRLSVEEHGRKCQDTLCTKKGSTRNKEANKQERRGQGHTFCADSIHIDCGVEGDVCAVLAGVEIFLCARTWGELDAVF